MVLCGGADLHNSINDYLMFASVHALSPTGQCHTFDASADGIVLGEGVACVVLKRLVDAERDGDRVYAVVKGVAGASDGKSLGLTAPRKDGQVRALERAYSQAGMSPAQVGLVEAHGTGTIVGDRTELATLTEVYSARARRRGTCVLGSVKSQIGHTKCAAGMAGLIKTALAIHHGVLPPTLNIKQPNPAWRARREPVLFLEQARPWPAEERVARGQRVRLRRHELPRDPRVAPRRAHRARDRGVAGRAAGVPRSREASIASTALAAARSRRRVCAMSRVRWPPRAPDRSSSRSSPESIEDLRAKLDARESRTRPTAAG